MAETGFIRVTHLGTFAGTLYLKDLDGEINRGRQKVPVYLGSGKTMDILLTDRVLASMEQGDLKQFEILGYVSIEKFQASTEETRTFHKPTITPSEAEVAPGAGPSPVVFGTVMGLDFDNPTDKAYRVLKIDTNFVGNASFHVHWTKSGDANESGNTVRWRLSYTVFNGNSDEVALVAPTIITFDDTYDDSGTTSRIIHRSPNIDATGFQAGYYVGLCLDYDNANTTLASTPVAISADLLWEGTVNV